MKFESSVYHFHNNSYCIILDKYSVVEMFIYQNLIFIYSKMYFYFYGIIDITYSDFAINLSTQYFLIYIYL